MRRSSSTVRALIADAAREEFAENGYERASVRAIADRAGVTESAVFRHFPGKAALFRITAAEPFISFINDFAASMPQHETMVPITQAETFVSGFFDVCVANKRILQSLSARLSDDEGLSTDGALYEACLDALVDSVNHYVAQTGNTVAPDIRTTVRLSLALILGAALNQSDLFPQDTPVDEIKHQLSRFLLFGAGYLPRSARAEEPVADGNARTD